MPELSRRSPILAIGYELVKAYTELVVSVNLCNLLIPHADSKSAQSQAVGCWLWERRARSRFNILFGMCRIRMLSDAGTFFVTEISELIEAEWHICISKLTSIGSDNGLSPGRRQAIIWTNAGISLIGPQGTNLSDILIKIHTFSFKKMHLKMSSGKWRPFCLDLNVLN